MIYLCRHGQTDYNRDRRVQGRIDSQLTHLGERQAAAMGDLLHRLIGCEIDVPWRIVASPLRRARASADIIAARLNLPVELDERLTEITVGEWEGRLYTDLAREYPKEFGDSERFFRGPGGENYDDVVRRVSAWLQEQDAEANRRLIVVSHGVAGRLLRGAYAGLSRDEILQQDVMSQDAIFRLSGGEVERLECEPLSDDPH